jgi:hypothetical protein
VYAFNEEDPKDFDMPAGTYREQMGYVPCPFYDRVSWEELAGEIITHDADHVNHVDHTLHMTTATS